MSYKLLRDNPVWLYIGSIFIFSFLVVLLLFSRELLFPNKSVLPKSPTSAPQVEQLSISIPSLQNRQYSPTDITIEKNVSSSSSFTSQIISFSVDGLKEYALLDTPTGNAPTGGFPVIILNHGYINPQQYDTVNSYAGVVNFFAEQGFIVIKPDYRGNGNSQGFDDPLKRFKYPIDIMTMIASVKNISNANPAKVYLWGHSMGGEITLEVLEILGKQSNLGNNVRATVLWAPVTDPGKWFNRSHINKLPEAQLTPFPYTQTFSLLGQPSDNSPIWQSLNPLNFLSDINMPVQLNHGTSDPTVPYSWSQELNQKMQEAGRQIQFVSYPGADHNMNPVTSQVLENNLQFFHIH